MAPIRHYVKRLIDFVDGHPRTGWYVTIVVTANFLWNVGSSVF